MLRIENIGALDSLQERFRRIAHPDATPLMVTWQQVIEDDNRKGILAGLDYMGRPLVPVTYRPVSKSTKPTKQQRSGQAANRMRNLKLIGGVGANLTSPEYRQLGGPPLAPRGQFSRVISNLRTGHAPPIESGDRVTWEAFGYWDDVMSKDGRPFLVYHFNGAGRLPVRDLRGVRPDGIQKAKTTAVNWMMDIVRSGGP